MSKHTKLIIVILNYLDTQVTLDCLHSLAPCKLWGSNEARVVIWENGTGPEAVALLQDCIQQNQWESWVELLVSPVNLGFTGGNNRVIERALQNDSPPDYFLLLNSDTLVTEQSLRSLIDFMDTHPGAGICGSQLFSESGEVQASPFRFPGFASELDNGLRLGLASRLLVRWNVVMPTPQQPCAVDWVSGASMLLRRQMLEQIGLLDEGFFTYFEDVDLCKRAQLKGWQVWYVPESQVVHLEGASSGIVRRIIKRRPAYWFRARNRFYLKHYSALHAMAIDAAFITGFALWRLRRLLQNKPDNDPPFMLYDFIRHSVFFTGLKIKDVNQRESNAARIKSKQYPIEHLLVLPVPFRRQGEELWIEAQALHGLHLWLDSFETLALAAAVIPEYLAENKPDMEWLPPDSQIKKKVRLIPLPWAYRPDHFVRSLPKTKKILNSLIKESRYLQFALSGCWGDWSSVASELAIAQQRRFAVHTDRVEHEVVLRLSTDLSISRRLRAKVDAFLIEKWHRRIIRRCTLGLFHGKDTFDAYKEWMKDRRRLDYSIHNIHNIHDFTDIVDDKVVQDEAEQVKSSSLNILYTGRLAPEKAPLEWVESLRALKLQGINFKAVWAGDGALRSEFEQKLVETKLIPDVYMPGFISDRNEVGKLFRQADLFVFTHITPESPRCLLEALQFGVPIIGYDSAFARDLISKHGGGVLVPCGDWKALGDAIARIVSNPTLLAKLKQRAAREGKRFTSLAVFSERSELIKKHLP
jgi:N-acetylglucosaminyl-diphospho-decaprenol L-rhamnosyltransferase